MVLTGAACVPGLASSPMLLLAKMPQLSATGPLASLGMHALDVHRPSPHSSASFTRQPIACAVTAQESNVSEPIAQDPERMEHSLRPNQPEKRMIYDSCKTCHLTSFPLPGLHF